MPKPDRPRHWFALTLTWAGLAIVVSLLGSWLFEANFILAIASGVITILLGLGLLIGLLVAQRWQLAGVLILAAAVVTLLPIGALGHWTWSRISLEQNRTAYDGVVRQAGTLPASGHVDGISYWIEDGPPRRIAFAAAYGIPDGWSAVVHDPSGTVGDLEGQSAYLFDDEIQSCIRITGPWHRCWLD